MDIGKIIKRYRKTSGLTQGQLGAIAFGLDKTAAQKKINRFELNKQEPNISELFRLAEALNKNPVDLLELKTSINTQQDNEKTLFFKKDLDATKDKLKLTEDNAAAYKELFEKYKEENERLTAENKTLRAENEALKEKLAGPDCRCGEGLKKRRAV